MKAKRRRHEPAFKARVALEAVKGIRTIQDIAKEYDIHPMQVTAWKKTLQQRVCQVFEREGSGQPAPESESEKTDLHAKIGELTVKLDFLEKKSRQLGL